MAAKPAKPSKGANMSTGVIETETLAGIFFMLGNRIELLKVNYGIFGRSMSIIIFRPHELGRKAEDGI